MHFSARFNYLSGVLLTFCLDLSPVLMSCFLRPFGAVCSVIAVPFRVGFDVQDNFGFFLSDIIVDSLFGVDCILTFRTAFFDERLVRQLCALLSFSK